MRAWAAGSPRPAAPGERPPPRPAREAPARERGSCLPRSRQDKEAWIKDKYVEKKFLRKLPTAPAREAPRRWRAQKQRRPAHSPHAPDPRCKGRLEPVPPSVAALSSGAGAASGATLSSGCRAPAPELSLRSAPRPFPAAAALERRFRRDSLFCPDELDSLFSYFDAGAAGAGPRSKCSGGPQPLQGSRAGAR